MQELIKNNIERYRNILEQQIFLQESGVSFSYTDSITYFDRIDLVESYNSYLKMKNEKNQEILNGHN